MDHQLMAITLSKPNRVSNFFWKICNSERSWNISWVLTKLSPSVGGPLFETQCICITEWVVPGLLDIFKLSWLTYSCIFLCIQCTCVLVTASLHCAPLSCCSVFCVLCSVLVYMHYGVALCSSVLCFPFCLFIYY